MKESNAPTTQSDETVKKEDIPKELTRLGEYGRVGLIKATIQFVVQFLLGIFVSLLFIDTLLKIALPHGKLSERELLAAACLLGVLPGCYFFLGVFARPKIQISGTHLKVEHLPFPRLRGRFGRVELERDEIDHFLVVKVNFLEEVMAGRRIASRSGFPKEEYKIFAMLKNEQKILLLSRITDRQKALHIGRMLNRYWEFSPTQELA